MELRKELKEKVENAKSAEEAKKILKDAGLELTEEEMNQVAGGMGKDLPWGLVGSGKNPNPQHGLA